MRSDGVRRALEWALVISVFGVFASGVGLVVFEVTRR